MNDTIISIVKLDGQQFKDWAHKMETIAILNGAAKTAPQLLCGVYDDIYENANFGFKILIDLIYCRNRLDFLANYQPTKTDAIDFILLKAEFVRLMLERAGVNK